MPEDSLLKRVREAREKQESLHKLYTLRLEEVKRKRDVLRTEETAQRAGIEDRAAAQEYHDRLVDEIGELHQQQDDLLEATKELEVAVAEAAVEGSKLRSDALKHQATLAAGAIAGIAAITQVVMPQPLNAILWLWATYVVLLQTVWLSVVLMHIEGWNVEHALRTGEEPSSLRLRERVFEWAYLVSIAGLPVAVSLFLVFQLFNIGG
jgi:hypothetical protein